MEKFKTIVLNREDNEYMYIQLYTFIKELIEKNILSVNEKLPPIRKLAKYLDINSVTVVNAYRLLERDNYVYKKVGSGTFVSPRSIDEKDSTPHIIEDEVYEDLKLMDRGHIQLRSDTINFASATPTPDLFPIEDFKIVLNEILDRDKGFAFGYQESKGFYQLRESIKDYLETYGIYTEIDNVQIISGAQQGIDVISKALLNYGDTVVVERPTYTGAIATFKSRGVKIIEVPINEDGIDLDILEGVLKQNKTKLIYTMPNFQNPTGYSYSSDKKRELLKLTEKYNTIVVEDDYLSDLNFLTLDNKTIKSMDEGDRVIYIKSFSKIFMPGLRLGFLIVPRKLDNDILLAKHTSDISTSGLIQRAFDLYLRKGIWRKHITFMKNIYKERFVTMIESIEDYFPIDIKFKKPKGGINFWVGLPEGVSSNDLYSESINKNIVFVPGSIFYPTQRDSNYLRLSIAAVYPTEIRQGIRELGSICNKYANEAIENKQIRNDKYAPIL